MKIQRSDDAGARTWNIIGDPTEGAMIVAAAKSGYLQDEVAQSMPRVQEIPFDSERKRMTTIHRNEQAGAAGTAVEQIKSLVVGGLGLPGWTLPVLLIAAGGAVMLYRYRQRRGGWA